MHGTAGRPASCDAVVVVGGGRWADIWCRVVSGAVPDAQIHQISPSLHRRAGSSERGPAVVAGPPHRLLWPTVASALAGTGIRHRSPGSVVAVVANAPADHGTVARSLIEAGVPTLVEKPFTLDLAEAVTLVDLAAAREVPLLVDHELLLASYLHQVRTIRGQGAVDADRVEIEWHDVEREIRHEMLKAPDPSVSVVADLLPHVLSMARVAVGSGRLQLSAVSSDDGGRRARVDLSCGATPITVSLDRRAPTASRRLLIRSGADRIELDFTGEPGVIKVNGRTVAADGRWDHEPRPLTAAFNLLGAAAAAVGPGSPLDAAANLDVLATTLEAERELGDQAFSHLARAITLGVDPGPHRHAITRDLARDLINSGAVDGPGDAPGLERLGAVAYDLVATQSNDPFVTQEDLLAGRGLGGVSARILGVAIRRSPLCQRLLTSGGRGRKYTANTILPALRSGSIDAALHGRVLLPFRIGLYPGQSCMFNCTFCGRNPTAVYRNGSVDPGTQRFEQLLRQVDAGDDPHRFYLSGGLEPLTNRFVGRLAEAGADAGHALSLYTNGFMLTPALLRRQPGLWRLRSLRISLYGVDQETSAEVTGRASSFPRVRANAVDLLRARDEAGSNLQVGFNFVVLPDRVEQVLRLVELIGEMNAEGGGRPIDFLTLREDFSASGPDQGLSPTDREQLRDVFDRVEARCTEPDLAGLKIDYGYGLDALRRGVAGEHLRMVTAGSLRPYAHPQVSVVIDLLGDVYAYREAGFLDRPGADRYRLGRIDDDHSLTDVIRKWLDGPGVEPRAGDERYLDIFDHVIALTLAQADADVRFGSPLGRSLVAPYGPAEGPSPVQFENAHFAELTEVAAS